MESASSTGLGGITSKVCQNETSSQANVIKEPARATNTLNDIPEALQEVKKHLGDIAVENVVERIKMAKNGKEKQSNDLDRAGFKRKLESEEKPAVKKEARMLELDNQLATVPLPHIPLKSLMDVEIKLVYIDEEDITYEFIGSMASTSTQSMCRDVEIVDSLSAPNFSFLPQIDKWLQVALKDASTCYRQKKYAVAAGQFRTALELCSKGAALGKPFNASPQDISSIASFIETKLVTCYLRMRKPDLALNHSHRSIILNPAYFRNHLRQAAVFRWLERYSEAARSAMTADYMYWLSGGSEQHISKLIKLYWQAMIEEAIIREESFSVMYTPFATKAKADKIDKMKDAFAKKHPDYVEYIYTDPHGLHVLPQTVDWAAFPPQQFLLTLGFKNKEVGKLLEKVSSKKLPSFSGVIEKLQYASLLCRLQRVKEQSQVINQAMAELATIPYLQDISQQDAELLQSLMADAMDTLEGRSDKERVWNKIQKVGIIEDFLYQLEDSFLKTKKLRTARRQKMKMKRLQSVQQH
ncbi:spermatogenesis-associated protein 16 isoform X2 [Pelodiscus sinensis]|uniref:spermatogenesis-associated protein 16 isoform X2 n=1 Tax=Pelodiscus sinensis TaxID=13735 RepID=UPI000D724245|nr:spermatogenesis-associated protein 16 isoform X3 [Pelodiscus sinensis]|eukprot:XP_025046256.1 spermatogenesis-associated protein 16 isoform X3 [Pelodiscus sinensis]